MLSPPDFGGLDPENPHPFAEVPLCSVSLVACAMVPTYSQQGLIVVDVFGGKRWTHAKGKGRQWQTGQQPRQQELQLDLLLVGRGSESLAGDQRLTWKSREGDRM